MTSQETESVNVAPSASERSGTSAGALENCPFCGSGNTETDGYHHGLRQHYFACRECDCEGPYTESFREAREAWNRRAAPSAWLPIESAPRDGTEILGWTEDAGRVVIRWGKHNHVPIYGWIRQIELYGEEVDGFDPELWSALPPPPEKTA